MYSNPTQYCTYNGNNNNNSTIIQILILILLNSFVFFSLFFPPLSYTWFRFFFHSYIFCSLALVADKNKSNDEFCFLLRPITVCAFLMRRPADGSARGSVGGCLPEPIKMKIIMGARTFGGSFVCAHTIQYTQYTVLTGILRLACTGTYKYTKST